LDLSENCDALSKNMLKALVPNGFQMGSPFKMTNFDIFDQFWMKASSQRLQALCARQRFSEAVPLFRRTLEILQAQPRAMRKPETKPGTKAVNWI